MTYSTQQQMIVAAAREIRDHEVVFVGMRLPIVAFALARTTHAPHAVGLFECGIARYQPASEALTTMADPPNQLGAAWATGLIPVMGLLQSGRVDVGFIGGAEVDRFGNVNSSYIGDFRAPKVKLPGSGGAPDIAAMAKRLLVIVVHHKHRLVERVGYVTSPGYLDGGESRARAGLGGGPAAVITDRAVLRPYGPDHELHLDTVHPGETLDTIAENTGWHLKTMPEVRETPPPTEFELEALRRCNRGQFT